MADTVPVTFVTGAAGFVGLALVPESSIRDELRQGALVALDVPAMRATIPITAMHRKTGYLSPAARALLQLLTRGPMAKRRRRASQR